MCIALLILTAMLFYSCFILQTVIILLPITRIESLPSHNQIRKLIKKEHFGIGSFSYLSSWHYILPWSHYLIVSTCILSRR